MPSASKSASVASEALEGVTGTEHSPLAEPVGRRYPLAAGTRGRKGATARSARLVILDAIAATIAVATGLLARFGLTQHQTGGIDYRLLAAAMVPAWLLALTLSGSYDSRFITAGAEQYRRVLNASAWLLAGVALLSFALRAEVSREFVLISLPYAAALTIVGRFMARKALHRQFSNNQLTQRVVAVGSAAEVSDLVVHLHRASNVGYRVVAAVTPHESTADQMPEGVRWVGSDLSLVVDQASALGADSIAVAGPHLLARGALRQLSWDLEGTDIELLVAPAITDIAGPRIRIRPIDGLPLLHVEKPQFTGVRRITKGAIDRMAALVLLLTLSPILAATAIAVRFTSPGPVLFRHTRLGRDGRPFAVLKFRTMYRTGGVATLVEGRLYGDPALPFKSRRDPRVTSAGRFLRRFSIDELPQLWNVLTGEMSLVGPRPLVPSEVEGRGLDVRRRLLVKPGITGLWQVSGRSDVAWDERMRLDLHYVDNWSVGLDCILLWKTVASVVRGRGAY